MTDHRELARSQMRGRYWISGTGRPAWVPLVDIAQVSDTDWNRRAKQQRPWVRFWLRWFK